MCDGINNGVDKDGFKDVGSFEDDLYTGMSEYSSEFILRPGTYGTEMKMFFIDF